MEARAVAAGVYLTIAASSFIAWRHWRRTGLSPAHAIGLRRDRGALLEFACGIAIGSAAMAGVFLALWLGGYDRVRGVRPPTPETARWLLVLPFSAFAEEVLFRGLLLGGMLVVLRRRSVAVAAMAALFGLAHATSPHASLLGVSSNALGGVVYGVAFLGSGRIWLPYGLHLAWNLLQGPILGFRVSGRDMGGLLQHVPQGPTSLTGGPYGPEASLLAIAFRLVALGLVAVWIVSWMRSPDARSEDARGQSS